ncbi:ATP-dependent DNA helicase DinG [Phytohalomonas tamaricis]|uniref:ATP-dependent DNA helicase DinG n=1 Tax=Phytohalomonas tamaricis TaxID=2081032 RepID=UPI000D0B8597|nr:ATP-dependent DNA helicase DinG [Phytohalomonas tamaricis]
MLEAALKTQIQEAYRQVLEGLELTPRYGQRLMIAEIARTLGEIEVDDEGRRVGNEHVCVLEAGTGTGKTLAYLLAALPIAKARGKRLVVATATVALQEQVLYHDLPALKRHSGLSFEYGLAKGRRRYLCVARLEQVLDGVEANPTMSLFEQQLTSGNEALAGLAQELAESYAAGQWAGDRDSWPVSIEDNHWRQLTTDHRQCTNRRCGHFGACAFFRARRQLDEADIIVANHDLVLADLSLGGGMVLPPPKDCIYIFDEGHHLPDKALEHFYHRLPINGALRWLGQLKKSLTELNTALAVQPTVARLLGSLPEALAALEPRLGEAFRLGYQFADSIPPATGGGRRDGENDAQHYRFPMGRVPEGLMEHAVALVAPFAELSRTLETIGDILRESLDPDKNTGLAREQAEAWLPLVALLHGRALEAHGLWQAFAEQDDKDSAPRARWLTFETISGDAELIFSASPVSAAETLARHLWGNCFGAVLTSATLTALGRFDRIQERAGLANRYRYQRLPSPFDYSRAVLSVPKEAVDPGDRDGHERAIRDFIVSLQAGEAALVLFSSRKQLRAVEKALPESLADRVLSQDRLPKRELLDRHRQRVDAGQGSIIFGMASFAEGIDLPGKYLTHVIITRLPFSVPDDPVGATLAEWIESRGGNAFMRISVPDASIKLIQACGRLIRKEIDTGRITLLDRRVLTRRYGQALLDSLPPFRREIEGVEVPLAS